MGIRTEEIQKCGGQINGSWVIFNHFNMESYIQTAAGCRPEWVKNSAKLDHFYGSENYKAGVDIVRHGLDISHEAIHLGEFPEFQNQNTEMVDDVVGGAVNIGNYLEGIPENMFDFRMTENPKFIDVVMATGEVSSATITQMNMRAMGTAWLVDRLESDGYRVRLRTLSNLRNVDGHGEINLVNIKNYSEPLALGQISGACAPAFFRRVGLRHMERFFENPGPYGRCMDFVETKAILPLIFPQGEEIILLPTVHMMNMGAKPFDLRNKESAVKWAEHYSNHKITI